MTQEQEIKIGDVPEILRGLKVLEDDAIDKKIAAERILKKVKVAKKKIFEKFPEIKNQKQ